MLRLGMKCIFSGCDRAGPLTEVSVWSRYVNLVATEYRNCLCVT